MTLAWLRVYRGRFPSRVNPLLLRELSTTSPTGRTRVGASIVFAPGDQTPSTDSPSASTRTLPVFVSDYCFLRDARDEDVTTVFVGRLYPSRNLFATVVSEKGAGDEVAAKLLADFLHENGVKQLVYKSD